MRNLIVVAFLEPVAEGFEFARADWPLHITLVRFDVNAGVPATEDNGDAGAGNRVADAIAELVGPPVEAALGSRVTAGAEAGFGRSGQIPVNVVEPSGPLQDLHEALVRIVEALPGRILTPAYTREGYRPHVSHRGDKHVSAGEDLILDRIALVDMAPDGRHATRRILKLWQR
jgi:hypothetical protein